MTRILTVLSSIDDPELIGRVVDRREIFRRGGAVGAALAVASVPAALAIFTRKAFAQGGLPQQIVDALNFALTLEYLEDEFYRTGLDAGVVPATDLAVFQQISKHETAHVALLQGALGGAAVAKPTFDFTAGGAFGDVFTNYATFQALAQGFEDTGVRAYKGQAGELMSNDAILTTALQIHSVEARHASEVRRLRGQKGWITGSETDVPALADVYAGEDAANGGSASSARTEAFDEPLSKAAVLAIAGLFIADPAA